MMMMVMVVVVVVTVATVPIIRPIVGAIVWLIVGVRAVRIIVPIRVIVVAWKSVPNAEVHLSIGTWCRHEGQAPCHQCD